jgi:hypothetical protein
MADYPIYRNNNHLLLTFLIVAHSGVIKIIYGFLPEFTFVNREGNDFGSFQVEG